MPRKAKPTSSYPDYFFNLLKVLETEAKIGFTLDSPGEARQFNFRFYDFRRALSAEQHPLATLAMRVTTSLNVFPSGKCELLFCDPEVTDKKISDQISSILQLSRTQIPLDVDKLAKESAAVAASNITDQDAAEDVILRIMSEQHQRSNEEPLAAVEQPMEKPNE
jgi:hypothetical protein